MIPLLFSVGRALLLCSIALQRSGSLRRKQAGFLVGAAAQAAVAVAEFLLHNPIGAANAACCGWLLWLWWHSGGSSGTRRRLRRLRSRFAGVRRTAPAAAMAVGR